MKSTVRAMVGMVLALHWHLPKHMFYQRKLRAKSREKIYARSTKIYVGCIIRKMGLGFGLV